MQPVPGELGRPRRELSRAGNYNNQLLELRIDQVLEGVQTPVRLETKDVKLLQPFGNDFDDFG